MKSLKGHFLVASSHLGDPNFVRTVLLLFEHNPEGAAGVVLNRPTGATIAEVSEKVFEEATDWDKPIHLGGPVPGPLMVLHELAELGDQEVLDGIFSTVDPAKIHELVRRRVEPSVFLANYAGWGPGQLEAELAEDSWLSTPADPARVLRPGDVSMWDELVRAISASHLSEMLGIDGMPEDPSVN